MSTPGHAECVTDEQNLCNTHTVREWTAQKLSHPARQWTTHPPPQNQVELAAVDRVNSIALSSCLLVVGESELSALGVSVYSQEEFEEGVMRKLDEEVTRKTNQQMHQFAEKELAAVQRAIRWMDETPCS